MYVAKDNQRLYLDSWSYNAALVLTELAKIVWNNGGRVKPVNKALVTNRSLSEIIDKYQNKIDRLSQFEKTDAINKAIAEYTTELEKYKAINNSPVTVTNTDCISFVFDGMYYDYILNDNPFFPFCARKTPITDGKYSLDACSEEVSKEWKLYCFHYANGSVGEEADGECIVCGLTVRRKKSGETEADATLKCSVRAYEQRTWEYLSQVQEGEAYPAEESAFSVFIPRAGEDLWQVAKRLACDPEELKKSNAHLEFPLKEGERIFVYRQIT